MGLAGWLADQPRSLHVSASPVQESQACTATLAFRRVLGIELTFSHLPLPQPSLEALILKAENRNGGWLSSFIIILGVWVVCLHVCVPHLKPELEL